MTYRIKDWDEIYENSRSRIIKDCRWVPIPNKQDGLGYSRLITGHGNGAAHYGVWVAIVCLCSRQTMPRLGYLTDNGEENGSPLTALDISLITRITENHIVEALPRFVEIGWMSNNNNDMAPRGNKAALQSPSKEGNRIEEKGIEKKKNRRKYPPEFERLWKVHPKGGKIAALKAFEKLDPDVDTWIEKLLAFKKTKQWREGYAPHLSTWLNQGQFDGEIENSMGGEEYDEQKRQERATREESQRLEALREANANAAPPAVAREHMDKILGRADDGEENDG